MNLKELRRLNFKELIEYDVDDLERYCFRRCLEDADKGCEYPDHPRVVSYCTLCEEAAAEESWEVCEEESLRLCYISHGSTTDDFMASSEKPIIMDGWHDAPVMFVMENPSKCRYEGCGIDGKNASYNIYEKCRIVKDDGCEYEKWPAKKWYWIHRKQTIGGYPEEYTGGKYGGFVASVIKEFELSNAYMTNLVKCGLNDPDKDAFRNTGSYNKNCVELCYAAFLSKEIAAVKPKVIFAFGANVRWWLEKLGDLGRYRVVELPHPAKRSLPRKFFQTLYFCEIAKALVQEGIISEEFYLEKMKQYASLPECKEDQECSE